jgi:endonuclease/exonuclease/phosphatase family metal-dependent hydrolase
MPQTLRLVTYNLQRGIHYDRIREHFATLPALREADIVAVQEAQVLLLDGGTNTLARLAADLEGEYRWTYRTVMAYPGKEYGNGFLFRPSVTPGADQVVPLPQVARLGWVARLKTEGGAPDTKSAFAQVFGVAGRRVRVVSLHLDFAGGADHRVRQFTHLLDALERTDGAAGGAVEVLCGDFNTSGHYGSKGAAAQTQRVLDVALTRGFSDCSAGVPWTSDLFSSIDDADPARRLLAVGRALGLRYRQKLDHLLVRGTRRLATARVVAAPGHPHLPGSDHVPVAVELIL